MGGTLSFASEHHRSTVSNSAVVQDSTLAQLKAADPAATTPTAHAILLPPCSHPPARARPQISSQTSPGSALKMDRESKKESFRKYLESSGVLDTLTKVLVALYEENDKPSSAVEFVQQKLGGPSISDYEKLKAEKLDLQLKYNELLETHKETNRQLEELKNSKNGAPWNGDNGC
ncbi:hypothetical protein BRADI_1g55151v3 [Brachypodium distachyon]|uniref:c-Myc-binding protein n=2 Tax=Brachypodium distachyon TaxID=15368 RepID=A0A0Q3NST9_BRADI|nr:hypothetical protein BRADI_1g55151v3 [Brachypodium distachyon]